MARGYDPILLETFKSLYAAVAEEMGVTLRRTAFPLRGGERLIVETPGGGWGARDRREIR